MLERDSCQEGVLGAARSALLGENQTIVGAIRVAAVRKLPPFDRWFNEENLINCQPGWISVPGVANALGLDIPTTSPKEVMEELAMSNSAFEGATYLAMDEYGVRLSEIGETV